MTVFLRRVVAVFAAVVVGALSLSLTACSPATTQSSLKVVATTTQVTEFTKAVVGSVGTVTGLLSANQSAHSFDPSAQQLVALAKADAVVMNGSGLEPWLKEALAASGFTGVLIDASKGIALLESGETSDEHEAHGEDEPHEGDPHVWTDPSNAQRMVANIAAGLIDVVAKSASVTGDRETLSTTLEKNASGYERKLTDLNSWVLASMAQVPEEQRLLVTNHDAFTYFVQAFGITFVGSIIPSFDDNAEPSAASLDALVNEIKATGTKAIFSEASISPKLANTIATEAGVTVYSGDQALYSDSLGAPGTPGATYISATVHNVTVLLNSWGAVPLPLPTQLS